LDVQRPSLFLLYTAATHSASLPYRDNPICLAGQNDHARNFMLDLLMLALALGLFAVTLGYAVACDHL
jgi:hypothetical protein